MCNNSRDLKNSCLLTLTETWLTDKISDHCVSLPGFGIPCRSDRNCNVNKSRGGGVCLYVNEGWCEKEKVTVKQRLSTPELELISVSLRPRYLPREFGRVYVLVVYAPVFDTPSAIKAGKTIADAIYDLYLTAADVPCVIAGDFNHCELRKIIPSLKQYVSFPTRKNSTIDLCYGNIPHAYKSYPLPPIGNSDHGTVKLVPLYRPQIRTACIIKKTIKIWTPENIDQLKGCFEYTDWGVMIESSTSIDQATDVITSYIRFCEDNIVSKKSIKIFPNNKPWVTKRIKNTLNEKKLLFSQVA